MYDVFDEKLENTASKLNLTLVPAVFIKNAQVNTKAKGFVFAESTEQWVFKGSVQALVNLELDERRDSLHHRSSGLDSTSAKQCAKAGVLVAINIRNLRTLDPTVMGRVMQNILLCRQHKAKMCVISDAKTEDELPNELDIRSLLITLGMSPGEAKQTCENLEISYKKYLALKK